MTTILVTGAGGPAGRALGDQLAVLARRDPGLVVVGADVLALEGSAFPVTAVVPRVDDPAYAVAMRDLVGGTGADLVLPTVQEELTVLAALHAEVLDGLPGARVVVSDAAATARAADKLVTMWALDAAGVSVPRFLPGGTPRTARAAWNALGGPFVAKPRVSRGGRGVVVVDDPETPWVWDHAWVLQSFAPGTEYAPQVYRSPDTGEVSVVVLEKTALKEGRVGNAVGTRRLADDEAPDVAWLAERAVVALGLVGPVDLDVRRDADGVPVVLEVNARFGANSAAVPELLHRVLREWGGYP